jgi:uncharacterized protein (TIGR02246 family)
MHHRFVVGTCALFPLAAFAMALGGGDETAAIRKSSADFAAAWNKHDPKAIAAFWATDGDLIDPDGKASVGRAEVEKYFTAEHTGNGGLAHCTLETKKDSVRMLAADIALEDWDVILTGLKPEGAPAPLPAQFHRVVVIKKKVGDTWQIEAARPGVPQPVQEPGMPMKPAKGTK